jgi:hypothetical protein
MVLEPNRTSRDVTACTVDATCSLVTGDGYTLTQSCQSAERNCFARSQAIKNSSPIGLRALRIHETMSL